MATGEFLVKFGLDNAWVVRPGDKLVLGFSDPVSQADMQMIRERVGGKLPGVEIVVIDTLAHMAVYQPEPERM